MVEDSKAVISHVALARPRVLIVSWLRWVESARLAAALIQVGAEVHALASSFHPLRVVRGLTTCSAYGMVNPVASLRTAVLRTRPDLIVSCDDETTERLQHLLNGSNAGASAEDRFIAELIERSFGGAEAFGVCTSRAELMAAAAAAGVRVALTAPIDGEEALLDWIGGNGLPAFVKRDGTHGGNGVVEIRSASEARRAWRRLGAPPSPIEAAKYLIKQQDLSRLGAALTRRRGTLCVQRKISGQAANCLAVCKEGELLAYIGVEVNATLNPTGFGTIIRSSENADMRHAAEALARRLRLSGVFGLDFIVKEGTDEAYLIEMNPRATPLAHFHFGAGRDPAAALCAIVTNDLDRRERSGSPPAQPIAVFPHMLSGGASAAAGASLYVDLPWEEPALMRLSTPLPGNPFELIGELIGRFLL